MEQVKKKTAFAKAGLILLGVALFAVGLAFFHGEYLSFSNLPLLFFLSAVSMLGCAVLAAVAADSAEKQSKKKTVLAALGAALGFEALQWGITFFINVIIGKEQLNLLAVNVASAVLLVYAGVLCSIAFMKLTDKKTVQSVVAALCMVCFCIGGFTYVESYAKDLIYGKYEAAVPVTAKITNTGEKVMTVSGDLYVSTRGSDSNDGTKDAPFLTIEKAVTAVRNMDKTGKDGITVCIEAGEYRVSSLVFTKEDSGTAECPITYRAYGEGEVILNGGVTLATEDFSSVTEYPALAERLTEEAKNNVIVADLTKAPYDLTADDWGKIYAIGSYNTASSYDGDWTGPLYCELFVNDKRQTLARYPDSGFLMTEEVVSTGLGLESGGSLTVVANWYDIRNPEPDVYKINSELAQRIAGWKTFDDVWMFGYWKYDWADASTPIGTFEKETGILSPAFVSLYGTKTDAPYYFFNVLEELTTSGEWYLDRENGLLCLWAPEDRENAQIDLSLSLSPIIQAEADYLTFDGLTVKGTRGDGIQITGNGNTVQNCLIKNVAGNALIMTGYDNLAYKNEITRTGKGGIILTGGDTQTLTPGNNKADNNYIHDWSEIYLTYQPAVTLNGVGNICSHNEMVNSPHEAITYSGNNHIIEYNLIHDVCLLSDDAGAIYSGRSWFWYGNIIRYNCIYNLGSDGHTPDGIYLDDALSGQQVYGNLLINIPKFGIHLGGGRDNIVTNNIIINAGKYAVSFDDRARDGVLNQGWFTHAYLPDGDMWKNLYNSPWQSEIWQEAYPQYKSVSADIADAESAAFIPNPASTLTNNLIFDKNKSVGNICEAAQNFSTVENNAVFALRTAESIFTDAANGIYTIADLDELHKTAPDFADLPLDKIGRTDG